MVDFIRRESNVIEDLEYAKKTGIYPKAGNSKTVTSHLGYSPQRGDIFIVNQTDF